MRAAVLQSKRAIDAQQTSRREELLRSSVVKEKQTLNEKVTCVLCVLLVCFSSPVLQRGCSHESYKRRHTSAAAHYWAHAGRTRTFSSLHPTSWCVVYPFQASFPFLMPFYHRRILNCFSQIDFHHT